MSRVASVCSCLCLCLCVWLTLPLAARAAGRSAGREPVAFTGWSENTEAEAIVALDPDFMYEGATLRPGTMGIAAGLGFPFLLVEGAVGVSDGTDLRLGVRALYGLMSQLRLQFRVRTLGGREGFALALKIEGSYAFYQAGAVAAAISGTRDAGGAFGVVASVRNDSTVFFVEAAADLAFDLDPQPQALGGIPPPVLAVANLPIHAGVELKISRSFHLTSLLGVDLHFGSKNRLGEAPVMPYVAVLLDVLH